MRCIYDYPPPRGVSGAYPGRRPLAESFIGARGINALFRRKIVGLLCGKGAEPPRGRGRPSGARESQVFFGYNSPPPRGASGPVPGRAPLHAPRSPSWARHPFIRRHVISQLCGWDVAPPRRRGRPSGARESQLFLGGVITYTFSKIRNDITATTLEEHYIIWILQNPPTYLWKPTKMCARGRVGRGLQQHKIC